MCFAALLVPEIIYNMFAQVVYVTALYKAFRGGPADLARDLRNRGYLTCPSLQWCWVAVTVTTVIFLIVAAISALPKMKAAYTACIAAIFLAASGITAFGSISPILSHCSRRPQPQRDLVPPAQLAPLRLPPPPVPGVPLHSDA